VYQALLTKKYLTRKVMPMLAMAAVMLSVATILITWSVMGGFLKTLIESGRTLVGDVAIVWPNVGFAYYDDLIERLEADEMIDSATPTIETFGLIQLPDDRIELVSIKGVEASSYSDVTSFADTMWWKPITKPTPKDHDREDIRLDEDYQELFASMEDNGKAMTRPNPNTGVVEPAGVLGIEVTGLNYRQKWGGYYPLAPNRATPDGSIESVEMFMPRDGEVGLTILALDATGKPIDPVTRTIPIANEFQSGLYEVDQGTIFVPLDVLQRMLRLDEAQRVVRVEKDENPFAVEVDPVTGEIRPKLNEVIGIDPARVTTVLVRGRDGEDLQEVRSRVRQIYSEFASIHPGEVPSSFDMQRQIKTWEDINRTMISAVKKETGLVLFVFGIVSFTTVFLVLAIFWSMATEKTKDIGILRALGASTPGIAWLWIRYGASIGIVGSITGTALGYVIVSNINAIHDWMGAGFSNWLSGVLSWFSQLFGGDPVQVDLVIWDPRQYYFIEIPSEVEPNKAIIVFVVGIMTCVLGAVIPAWHSARMDPVKALRFE
jgi:lipoprotein-releasing system permease protein